MISEGSCDTEDWRKDAENSTLHHRNILYFKMHSTVIVFYNFTVFLNKQSHPCSVSTKQVLLYLSLSPDFFEVIYHLGMSTKKQTSV